MLGRVESAEEKPIGPLLRVSVALTIVASILIGAGPVSAGDTPQTKPKITTLTLGPQSVALIGPRTLTIEWSGDDGDRFERTGFCVRYRTGESSFSSSTVSTDEWLDECLETRDRRAELSVQTISGDAEAKLRVNYANDLHSPWSETRKSTRAY